MSGLEIRVFADVHQSAFGVKDAVGSAGVLGEKASETSWVAALRGRMLHILLIEGVVQCVDGYGMFQCSTPFTNDERAQVLCLGHRLVFDFNKRVKVEAGCSRD